MKKIYRLLITILLVFTLAGCTGINITTGGGTTNNSENNGETDKIVSDANELADIVEVIEDSVIGVSLKYTHKTMINGTLVESTDVESYGSGVIYKRFENLDSEDEVVDYTYYVVTNSHVINGSYPEKYTYTAYIYLGNIDLEIEAEIMGYDDKADIALIKFNYAKKIKTVEFADSDDIRKGEYVFAIGNPDGFDYYGSVTLGVISGTLRYISEDTDSDGVNDFNGAYIQHDAAINPGNSGGGLFTIDGKLVGINTLKMVKDNYENMGFAVPSNIAKNILENFLEKGEPVVRPRLGITGSEVRELTPAIIASNGMKEIPDIYGDETPYGLYVVEVTKGGSVDGSGIKADDIILQFGSVKLTRMNILSGYLNSLNDYFIGSKVEITYYCRSTNTIKTTTVTLK